MHPLLCPLELMRTEVLPDKGCGSQGKALHRQHDKLVDFTVGGPAGHAGRTKYIDVRLYKHIGERCDGLLQSGRQTDADNDLEDGLGKPQLLPDDAIGLAAVRENDQHQNGGTELRNDSCAGNACNAHFECEDE